MTSCTLGTVSAPTPVFDAKSWTFLAASQYASDARPSRTGQSEEEETAKSNGEAPTPTVCRETLEETPTRTLEFLHAVGTSIPIPIRAALAQRGYAEGDHQEGGSLLRAASGFVPAGAASDEFDVGVRGCPRS